MISKQITQITLFFLVATFALITPSISTAEEKQALLIGIDDYSMSTGFSSLKGSVNDVGIMKNVLQNQRVGFDHITVITDSDATHSRISKAFGQLIQKIKRKKTSVVFIYFSGHGSLTPDVNGDEPKMKNLDGQPRISFDQTWVTYGSRLKVNSDEPKNFRTIDRYDIIDDEISSWLNDIAKHSGQVVFISDSCHSGSVSRAGIVSGIRRGPIDYREHPFGKKTYDFTAPKNIVRIGASKDSQLAREFSPDGSSEEYGVFTWYLAKALMTSTSHDTWNHVFNRASSLVIQETSYRQNPQISGAVFMKVFDRQEADPIENASIFKIIEKNGKKEVYISAGKLSGVSCHSVYTVETGKGNHIAPKIIITYVAPTFSIGRTKDNVTLSDRVVEIVHRHESQPTRISIRIEDGKDKKTATDTLRKLIMGLEPYRLVYDDTSWDLAIYGFRPEKMPNIMDNNGHGPTLKLFGQQRFMKDVRSDSDGSFHINRNPPVSDAMEIRILDRNGDLFDEGLTHPYTPEGMNTLKHNLLRLAKIKDFLRLSNPGITSPLQISVTPMVPSREKLGISIPSDWTSTTCQNSYVNILDPISLSTFLGKKWDLCTLVRFNAKNPTSIPYHFYVVSINSKGETIPVFPSVEDSSELAEIKPNSESVNGRALIRLDTPTADHYKLIVSRKPIDHRLFYHEGFRTAPRGNEKNPLEQILCDAVYGTRSGIFFERDSWYAETITIDMR